MKKVDVDDIGAIWVIILVVFGLIIASYTIGLSSLFYLILLLSSIIFTFGAFIFIMFGTPFLITKLWNKYIAKDE